MAFAASYTYFRTTILALTIALVAAGGAGAAPYADIVIDMRDGAVLHATEPDRRLHPASLTKMMTLYLTFEAVRAGQLGLDQRVRVSRAAAAQQPSKLYLKVGERVTVRSLIRAAAIKSANDATVVLAEAIAGTEAAFAKMMTARARQLGMKNTTFRNSNGLTAAGHLSTARDMALLGRRLFQDFPEYYGVFSRQSEEAAGRRIHSTNRLLGSYPGADGIKTGYTVASGYSLVASARRGSRHIVATVLGAPSSRWRTERMSKLLDMGFASTPGRGRPEAPAPARDLMAGADAPAPSARPALAPTGLAALGEIFYDEAEAAVLPTAPVGDARPGAQSATRSPDRAASGGGGTARAPTRAALPPARPGARTAALAPAMPKTVAAPSLPATAHGVPLPPRRPGWAVQLGAYQNRAEAVASVAAVTLGTLDLLAAAEPRIDEVTGRSGKLYRVRFTGLAARDATRACVALKAHGRDCITIPPGR